MDWILKKKFITDYFFTTGLMFAFLRINFTQEFSSQNYSHIMQE